MVVKYFCYLSKAKFPILCTIYFQLYIQHCLIFFFQFQKRWLFNDSILLVLIKKLFQCTLFATYEDIFYSDKNAMKQLLYIIVIIHQNASINVVGKCLKISYCCVFLNNLIWKIKVINFIQMQFKYAYHIYANKFLKK